jgi:hypothetical protein
MIAKISQLAPTGFEVHPIAEQAAEVTAATAARY